MTAKVTYHQLDASTAHLIETAEVFDNPVDPEQLTRFQADPGHHLVFAMLEDKVVGFASGVVMLHPDKQPIFFVNEVDVDPEFQRRGIATALCERLIARARDEGCKGIWLGTEADNTAARALYRRLEGRETPDIVIYDWDGVMGP